ncbi:DNA polymerase III subunit delta [Helicobacter sp. MIT 14-3879]|uniref:DNA polymerase III subunit delta n=1 Tax=Helicobacter sp. MIT 14-3879 TaxID=2040649 RepID=UPI000E1EDC27|nr:hypothetical protein [Helicobacter sp. MIT 14-3879]RDU65113.1 hypothetical protein CQA44_02025 [Helicobacter sp. MIT 14-3879]
MYKKDFDILLQTQIPQATFLYGECDFLINFYSNKIRDLIKKDNQIDIFSFYFEEYNPPMIRDLLSQQSLFSSISLIIIKLYKIKDYKKKPKDTEIFSFLEILKNNQTSYLIIEFYNEDSIDYIRASKAISSLFNTQKFVSVRFFNPTQKEALDLLKHCAMSLKLKISDVALNYLYEIQNKDLSLCVNELNKFVVISEEITKEIINQLSYGLYTNSIEEFCEALLDKGDYLKIIAKIEEEGVQDIDFIRSLQGYFYRLFLFFAYIKQNGNVNSNEILGHSLPKQAEEKYTRYAMKLREAQYLGIFWILNEWRSNIINGKEKNSFANLIKLQAIIK